MTAKSTLWPGIDYVAGPDGPASSGVSLAFRPAWIALRGSRRVLPSLPLATQTYGCCGHRIRVVDAREHVLLVVVPVSDRTLLDRVLAASGRIRGASDRSSAVEFVLIGSGWPRAGSSRRHR